MKYTTFVEIIIQRIGQYVNNDTYQVPVIKGFCEAPRNKRTKYQIERKHLDNQIILCIFAISKT